MQQTWRRGTLDNEEVMVQCDGRRSTSSTSRTSSTTSTSSTCSDTIVILYADSIQEPSDKP
jgi:hypothetical protein